MHVWCDGCGKQLDGQFTEASEADNAALLAGWTVVINRHAHLCPPCNKKAVAVAEASGLVFVPVEVN
jgi:Zn finger protein HypA/HybF involved in hydrogenase expression